MNIKTKILTGITALSLLTVAFFTDGNEVYAVDAVEKEGQNNIKAEISYYNELIAGKNNVLILLKDKVRSEITKEELIGLYEGNKITDVKNSSGNSIANTDKVKTTDKVVTSSGEYEVILVGDANGDGIICDTDDIMVVIEDYLGKNVATGEKKIAANLANSDNQLDTDDIMQMINKYLGKTENLMQQPLSATSTETVIVTPTNGTSVQNLASAITPADYGKYINYNPNVSVPSNSQPSLGASDSYTPDISGLTNWRVFYNDGTNVYIILDDALKYNEIPPELHSSDTMAVGPKSVQEDINGYADVSAPNEFRRFR